VHDVRSWALTNFEEFRARPAADELPRCIGAIGIPYFGKSYRLQRRFDSNSPVRTLSSVNDPGAPVPGTLVGARSAVQVPPLLQSKRESELFLALQWQLLRSRFPAGLLRLRERLAHWPSDYMRQHWTPFGPMLWLGK